LWQLRALRSWSLSNPETVFTVSYAFDVSTAADVFEAVLGAVIDCRGRLLIGMCKAAKDTNFCDVGSIRKSE
jgi:hypothetical protein